MSKKVSNIKDKIRYETDKVNKIEEKITKIGGHFNVQLVKVDASLQVIKDILFKEKKTTEEEFELKYLKKVQITLNKILEGIKKIKKEAGVIIIPKARVPKDLKEFKA